MGEGSSHSFGRCGKKIKIKVIKKADLSAFIFYKNFFTIFSASFNDLTQKILLSDFHQVI